MSEWQKYLISSHDVLLDIIQYFLICPSKNYFLDLMDFNYIFRNY